MANKELKQVSSSSLDIKEQNIERLKELFPDVITENKIDFDKLRLLLGDAVEVTKERYNFTWNGKTQAIQLVQKPTTSTLKPSKDKSKNWDETQNLYVEGDNLEVLKVLQKSYANKVRMIYLDPPYNTGRDFVYSDNFSDSLKNYKRLTGQVDDEGKSLITSVETGGRIHSKWLNMMYPRLVLARNLLKDEGVIFISIDEHEVSNLSKLCDEIFGEENCLGIAARVTKKSNNKGDYWAPNFDYILTYGKNRKQTPPFSGEANTKAYNLLDKTGPRKGEPYQLVRLYMSSIHNNNPEQRFYITAPDGEKLLPPGETRPPQSPKISDGIWRWTRKTFEKNLSEGKIVIKKVKSSNLINENGEPAHWNVFTKTYLSDVEDKNSAKPNSLIENHINQIAS
ncbi:site-specific DNA-methyltransferase, partial [Lactiplantibacillus plantarum]